MDRVGGAILAPEASPAISSDLPAQEHTLPKNSKLDRLERLFEKNHLSEPYRVSGPSIKFQYTGAERKYDSLIKKINSELVKYNLIVDIVYDNGVIEISPKDGPSRELLGEYRARHHDLFDPHPHSEKSYDTRITHSQTYCTQ